MKHIFFIFLLSLFASCFDAESDLEIALDFAGENSAELEKVLSHYENDPEKGDLMTFEEVCEQCGVDSNAIRD